MVVAPRCSELIDVSFQRVNDLSLKNLGFGEKMKSVALSLTLLAAASSAVAQSTTTWDFTATVSFRTFTKAHPTSSGTQSSGFDISSSPSSVTGSATGAVTSSVSSESTAGSGTSGGSSVSETTSGVSSTSGDSSNPSASFTSSVSSGSSSVPFSGISSSFRYSNSSTNALGGSPLTSSTVANAANGAATSSLQAASVLAFVPTTSTTSISSTTSASQTTTLDSATASAVLEAHNAKRALHQDTNPLAWSDDLSAWAFNYANSLKGTEYDPCSGNLIHSSTRDNQGENIAFGTYSSPEALVGYWYDEISDYDYNDVTGVVHNNKDVGHFTQLVWASSTQVGCAAINCPANNGVYLLCEYTPAGNVYVGNSDDTFQLFRTNVLPLKAN